MESTFSQNFHAALSASDEKFTEYIAGMARFSEFCQKFRAEQEKIAAIGPQRDQYLGNLTRPDGSNVSERLTAQLKPRPPEPNQYAIPNNTGIASYIYGNSANPEAAYSVDKLMGLTLSIAPDKCIPCLPDSEAGHLYPENIVKDPAQQRASQLMRMFISLHEIGHYHFTSIKYGIGHKTSGGDPVNSSDREQTERYADTFSLAFIIRELGPEGTRFARQILSGMRDGTHSSGDDYDNGTAIALLIKRYEMNPDAFKATSPENIPDLAFEIFKESSPSLTQDNILRAELSKAGLKWGQADKAHPYERAQQRLQWHQEQLSRQNAGEVVNQTALDIYEKHMAPGDQAMLSKRQMQTNLEQMALPTSKRGPDASAAAPSSGNIQIDTLKQSLLSFVTEAPSFTDPPRKTSLPGKARPLL